MISFKNDNSRLFKEFNELRKNNFDLYSLIRDLESYVNYYFKKDVIITMIYRTNEEQDKIYRGSKMGTREYDVRPWKSPHQFWHSVDIRSMIFDPEEIKKIEEFININCEETNYYKWTAKNHEVNGGGEHFHIQYIRKE